MIGSQKQSAETGAIAVQAAGDVTIGTVLTLQDVRQIAIDVYKANFYELAGEAKEIALARATQLTESYLERLQAEFPEGLQRAKDPALQHALYTAQKEHARVGDEDLSALLVDLLIDRTKTERRNLLQIVLDESITTASKLTSSQLAALSIIFLLRMTVNNGVGNHELLGEYFDKYVQPIAGALQRSNAEFQHLEFAGCGSSSVMQLPLADLLTRNYPGLFSKGAEPSDFEANELDPLRYAQHFVPSLQGTGKLQVAALNETTLNQRFVDYPVPDDVAVRIKNMFGIGQMNNQEVQDFCVQLRPYMADVFDWWNAGPSGFNLTSVGMAIGHANIQRFAGKFADLSIWLG